MKDFIKWLDNLPNVAKVLICIFTLPYGILLAAGFWVAIPLLKETVQKNREYEMKNQNTNPGADFDYNQQYMQDEMNRQFNEWSMEECRKAGTPFDHGGYMQGEGFNPSDTMAAEANRQMENMNHMNDFNNMGGMF